MTASSNFSSPAHRCKTTNGATLLAEYLETQRDIPSFGNRASAARHFICWLQVRRVPIGRVDATVVERFAHHQCHCSRHGGVRYSQGQIERLGYITNVRRFVSYLEDCGVIRVPEDLASAVAHLPAYGHQLTALGYSRGTRNMLASAAEHLIHWLRLSRISACDIDDLDVERFAHHDCRCFLRRKHGTVTDWGVVERRRGGMAFVQYLRGCGLVPDRSITEEDPRIVDFRAWLTQQCGLAKQTAVRYLAEAARWLPSLGMDPGAYDALTIRNVVLNQPARRSHRSVQQTAVVLRAYLRYLAASDACRPELVHAIPCVRRPRNAALPRFLTPATIERIIVACNVSTPVGLRDRAIILLLARLGLRAGDICQLKLADIDWRNSRLHVEGKSRRAAQLPLPQDAGDALLTYIERARPPQDDRVFLRVHAPFTSLSPSAIAGLVARARARAGVEGGPTGSHVFRHSLATSMVRGGSSLEQVGAILRHKSPSTTAIYAKVDVAMLARVAQPWPGSTSC